MCAIEPSEAQALQALATGQVNCSPDQVYYLLTDHLGSTTVSFRSDGGETRYQQYYPWGELRGGEFFADRPDTHRAKVG